MNSWQRLKLPASLNFRRASTVSVEVVGYPGFQALPNSKTMEPLGARNSANKGAKFASQDIYSDPCRFPYFFFRFKGNDGEVNIN